MKYTKLRKISYLVIITVLVFCTLAGCGSPAAEVLLIDPVTNATLDDVTVLYHTESPGVLTQKCDKAEMDYSNTSQGYITVRRTEESSVPMKVQIQGPKEKYTFNLTSTRWVALPLSDGDGQYTVSFFQNIEGTKYAQIMSCTFDVVMENEFMPFLYPNMYVDYSNAPNTIATAQKIAEGSKDTLDIVDRIYFYLTRNIEYDYDLAENVKSGYAPVLDDVLARRKGICFDYAAVMAGMLRSLNIPCKMVFGYADDAYHAWVSVYSDTEGWVEDVVHFDGKSWERMDPTMGLMIENGEDVSYTDKLYY